MAEHLSKGFPGCKH